MTVRGRVMYGVRIYDDENVTRMQEEDESNSLLPCNNLPRLKYILLLSVVQSQPTHTLAIHNQATGFSSKSHHQACDRKL
jgi:hypothetical protein